MVKAVYFSYTRLNLFMLLKLVVKNLKLCDADFWYGHCYIVFKGLYSIIIIT